MSDDADTTEPSTLEHAATHGPHLTWPDSDDPGADERPTRRGQPVVSGSPGLGVVTFGVAPRPFDLPDNPEDT